MAARLHKLVLLLACLVAESLRAAEFKLDARALLDRSVTENVRLSPDGSTILLTDGEVVEDDGPAAGYSYKPNEEKLTPGVRIKKQLLVTGPPGASATLLVGAGDNAKLWFEVNGRRVDLSRRVRAEGKWHAYDLPPGLLREGKNDVVIGGAGTIWIARDDEYAAGSLDRTAHPNRSTKSTDNGKTWEYDRLGTRNDVDGEYYVRLHLPRPRAAGRLTLPVIDLGNLEGRPVAEAIAAVGPVKVVADSAGDVSAKVRFGPTPAPGSSWGGWRDVTAAPIADPAGRYAEVAVTLRASDPAKPARLTSVTVSASPSPISDWPRALRLTGAHNPPPARSSIPFAYEPFDHPKLQQLREAHKVDAVVAGATDELDLIIRLAQWSAGRWTKGHLGQSYPAWDALDILKPHADGTPVGGFCQQYNVVFLQACEAFGVVGRAVSIGPGGLLDKPRRGGHEVVELWSNDFAKWVYVDGQFAWYAVDEKTGVPLSLLDLRQRQLDALAGRPHPPIRIVKPGDVPARAKEDWTSLTEAKNLPFGELRMIPRSNFLAQACPLPLNQGMRGWFWTGHHVYTDDALPASLIYSQLVHTGANWEPTLNTVHYTLEATPTPGEVRVHLSTHTPSLAKMLASVDGAAERPVESAFVWKLNRGKNRLDLCPTNVAGRRGVKTWAVLEY